MKSLGIALISLSLLAACGDRENQPATATTPSIQADPTPAPTIDTTPPKGVKLLHGEMLSSPLLVKSLPLHQREKLKSGVGLDKQLWKIKGMDDFAGRLEIIGNDQSDADSIGLICKEFDAEGNAAQPAPWPKPGKCYRFALTLLGNLVSQPDTLLDHIISQAQKHKPALTYTQLSDVTIEVDTEGYFSIRRHSRIASN